MSCTDWTTGDLGVRDVATGQFRRLTNTGGSPAGGYADTSTVSPDGKWIAYAWYNSKAPGRKKEELQLIAPEGGPQKVLLKGQQWLEAHAWTPDGKHVLIEAADEHRLSLVPLADGAERLLRRLAPHEDPEGARISPDGRWIVYGAPSPGTPKHMDLHLLSIAGGEPLRLEHPAQDTDPAWLPDGSGIVFLSNRSGENALWTLAIQDGKPQGPARVVRTPFPVQDTKGFSKDGTFFYGVSVAMQDAFVAPWDASSGKVAGQPRKLTERNAGRNQTPFWSRDGKLAWFGRTGSLGDAGPWHTISTAPSLDGPVTSVPVRGQLWANHAAAWSADGTSLIVQSGRCDGCRGGLVRLDPRTGKSETLIEFPETIERWQPSRLMTIDGKTFYLVLSERLPDKNSSAALYRYHVQTNRLERLMPMDWGYASASLSPDGRTLAGFLRTVPGSFALALLPLDGGPKKVLLEGRPVQDLTQVGGIAWEPDGKHLVYLRHTGKAEDVRELMRISTEGGAPVRVGFEMEGLWKPEISPDGRWISFQAGRNRSEMWAMDGLLEAVRNAK
ncbi:MAG: hypothetical protein AAB225_01350, partial [Acidobacteriota bacterium]